MKKAKENSPIIRVFHASKRFGKNTALVDVTLDIARNDFVLVYGPSGAGKSTLLKLLFFGESLSEGQIIIDGMNLARISRNKIPLLRREFGIIFQDFKLIPTKTVFENVALVLEAKGKSFRTIPKIVRNVLKIVEMENKLNAFPSTLSGGEQQRVAVARAIVGEPKIILADEPTGSLDAASAAVIVDLLKMFHARGATIVVATHDETLLNKINGRVIRLERGSIKAIVDKQQDEPS